MMGIHIPEPEPLPPVEPLPQVVTRPVARRTMILAFGMIGIALAGLLIIILLLFTRVGQAIDSNHDAIRKLNRLTHPTKAQFEEDLKTGIQRCLRSPECRKLFPTIRRKRDGAVYVAPQKSNRVPATLARTPGQGVVTPEGQRGTPVSQPSRPTATTNPPRRRKAHKKGGSPPPQSSGSPPDSAITLTAPLPVAVCRPSLVRVNCP